MRRGRFSGVIKVAFLTLLTLGTFGLVLSDVRGVLSDGTMGSNDVGAVGGEKVSLVSFDRMLNRTLPRIGISAQEAYQLGYVRQLLGQELKGRALEIAARKAGIEVSREQIAKQVSKIIDPIAGDKGNKQEVLEQVLRAQGLSEGEFVSQVGRDSASGLLTGAFSTTVVRPTDAMLKDLYAYENESRTLELIALSNDDYKLAAEPDDAALETAYEGLKENFAIPESRDVTLLILDDTAIKAKVDITDEDLRRIYNEEKDSFATPESRVVEQALLKDEAKAKDIAKAASDGKSLKEAVKTVTGDEKAYVGDIDFEQSATQPELQAVVFDGKNIGKVLGPVKTQLGYHVMIVKKINPPGMKSFDQVKEQIKKDQLEAKSSDQLYESSATLDDLLASSTPIEEIKAQVPLKTVALSGLLQTGKDAGGKDLLTEYKDDASAIVQGAFDMEEGEASPVNQLKDGRYYAIRADKVVAKSYKPFEEIKAQLKEQTIAADKAGENRKQAKALIERLSKGEVTLSALSEELKKPIKSLPGLKKTADSVPEPMIASTLGFVFAAQDKEPFLLDIKGGVAVAVVTHTELPKEPDQKALDALAKKMEEQEKSEAVETYTGVKMEDYGTSVNDALLAQMYGRPASTGNDQGGSAPGMF
jgi:peptidyl-prolyl cis-trans isomerase D